MTCAHLPVRIQRSQTPAWVNVALTDSTHGVMTAFEIVTVRVTDEDGMEGVGYTYTTGRNGGPTYPGIASQH